MKLGLVSAILDGWTMEEMVDVVSEMGFDCVEVACWPQGKAERRYAGVSHIDVVRVQEDDEYAKYVLDSFAAKNVQISSLAFYPNTMDGDLEKRANNIAHLKNVIAASAKLGVNIIAVRSENKVNVSPSADYRIQDGDLMVVLGDNLALEAVQKL